MKTRIETCKTFDTQREAAAFMLGYDLAKFRFHDTDAKIDPEEKQTVLLDLDTEDEAEHVLRAVEFNDLPK